MDSKIILNADDFGLSISHNNAVLKGYENGLLKSASIMVNTEAFEDALTRVLPKCSNLGIGMHLNIMEGKPITECSLLINKNGNFKSDYLYLMLNQNNKKLMIEIENEFEAQIKILLNYGVLIDHIDSHVHTHAIPQIFRITCRLAKKYNIKYIRTQYEKPYIVPNKFFTKNYMINFIKILLLKYYTNKNKKVLINSGLLSNDYVIGVGYTGMMDKQTIISGLQNIPTGKITEAIIHPCEYEDNRKNSHSIEYEILIDKNLKNEIQCLGYIISNYKDAFLED